MVQLSYTSFRKPDALPWPHTFKYGEFVRIVAHREQWGRIVGPCDSRGRWIFEYPKGARVTNTAEAFETFEPTPLQMQMTEKRFADVSYRRELRGSKPDALPWPHTFKYGEFVRIVAHREQWGRIVGPCDSRGRWIFEYPKGARVTNTAKAFETFEPTPLQVQMTEKRFADLSYRRELRGSKPDALPWPHTFKYGEFVRIVAHREQWGRIVGPCDSRGRWIFEYPKGARVTNTAEAFETFEPTPLQVQMTEKRFADLSYRRELRGSVLTSIPR